MRKISKILLKSTICLLIYLLLACWEADPNKRPEMSEVIKLLDTVNINDMVQHVENISENNLETNMDDLPLNDTKDSHEQMTDLSHFKITSTMEKLIQ